MAEAELVRDPDVDNVASGNSKFSVELLTALKGTHPKNLIYSAFSLSTVVAMVKLGARGETSKELAKTFNYPADDILAKEYFKILDSYNNNTGFTLAMANRLYSMTGFEISVDFASKVANNFLATMEQVDFSQNEEAASTINKFVEDQTQGKIKDLVSSGDLNGLTRLVLVNGIYFKGIWDSEFDPKLTKVAPFYLSTFQTVKVPVMKMTTLLPYTELPTMDAHAVALSYKGGKLFMIIIAPKSKSGLTKIENHLKDCGGEEILKKSYLVNVKLRLPRFELESTIQLVPILKNMGISTMFSGKADLRGIPQSGSAELYVSTVVQKAFVKVNEEGSEAAAVTAVVMMVKSKGSKPIKPKIIKFDADRPFLFQIVDRHTNLCLFVGRCHNPLAN